MNTTNSDLDLLENLSKKISDLLYNNKFYEISEIDSQRKALIKKIRDTNTQKNLIKARIANLVENNVAMIEATEKKLHKLSINHNKFNKRLKAYSLTK